MAKKDPLEVLQDLLDEKIAATGADPWAVAQGVIRAALQEVLTVSSARGLDGLVDAIEDPPSPYLAVTSRPGAHAVLFRRGDDGVDVCYSALARTPTENYMLAYEPALQESVPFERVTRDTVITAVTKFLDGEIL